MTLAEVEPLSAGSVAVRFALVFLLVFANGFFVAAEFALVGSRRTRIEALVRRGSRPARFAQHAIEHLDHYISATQLGITLSSLALGWLGEQTLATFLIQMFDGLAAPWDVVATHAVSGTIAFAFITFLHIVFGELAPKSVALLFPETTSLWLAGPLIVFARIFKPFIKVLNGSANLLLRMVGLHAPHEAERVHRPEEIEMLAAQAHQHGSLAEEPLDMIRGVFDLSERTVADVMTPRTRVDSLPINATIEEAVDFINATGHTRMPVFEKSPDDVKGFVTARDVWRAYREEGASDLRQLLRRTLFVPTTQDLESLLKEMRNQQHHVAMGIDEFGGVAGLVTIEDILEEIVGEIHDEHEANVTTMREQEGEVRMDGTVSLFEVNDYYSLDLPSHEYATVSGFIMARLGRIAQAGDEIPFKGGKFRVEKLSGRRIEEVALLIEPSVEE